MTFKRMLGTCALTAAVTVGGCVLPPGDGGFDRAAQVTPSFTRAPETMDEDAFWALVEAARQQGRGDPDAMAEVVRARLATAHDLTLIRYQTILVAASTRLYTWRHGAAADLVCGSLGDDGFTDWRSWVVTLGRVAFERIAADADNLAEVADLDGGCALSAEGFGAAASGIYYQRHGYDDERMPILEPGAAPPRGERIVGDAAARAALPRLAARI